MSEQSSQLGLGVRSPFKLDLTELCLSASAQKSLYDYCLSLNGDPGSQLIVDMKNLPAKPRNELIDSINKLGQNMGPSVQPGTAISGENIRKGIHTFFGYDPTFLPNEAVLYINMDGGAGLGIRFEAKLLKYELGIHLNPRGTSR